MSSDFLLRHLATINADLEEKRKKGASKKETKLISHGSNKRKTSDGDSSVDKRYDKYPLLIVRFFFNHHPILYPFPTMTTTLSPLNVQTRWTTRLKELLGQCKTCTKETSGTRKTA